MIKKITFFLFYLVFSLPSFAFEALDIPPEKLKKLMEEWKPLVVSGGAVPWDVFATTTEKEECTIDKEGYDYCIVKPTYSEKVKALSGTKIKLMGYMFPLGQGKNQKNFLIGPYPLSCPFHYHVGPAQTIEVIAKDHIEFSYKPILLEGIFSTDFNEETGVFYYLKEAENI